MKKYSLALFVFILLGATCLRLQNSAEAQGVPPQLLLTWQAGTYVPDGFEGKIMPSSDSQLTAGVDLVDLGKRVDLSTYKIYWYINDKFQQGGTGLTRINFTAPHFIGNTSIRLRAFITNYGSGPAKTITIPVVVPEAVIQASAPSLSASAAPFNVQAYPYFFNVSNLSQLNFSWSLNGTNAGTQNPFVVTKEMADKGPSTLKLSVSNPNKPIERITKELSILNN